MPQQFFLIAAFKLIIQRSYLCDNFQRQVQIIDMNLLLVLHRFERPLNSLSAILPFRPHSFPNLVRNLACRIQSSCPCFFVVNLLQRELELGAPIRTGMSHALLKFFGVAGTDEWNQIRIDLDTADFTFDRSIDNNTKETSLACAFNPIVGRASTAPSGVGCRAGHSAQLAIWLTIENQPCEQIKLLAAHGSMCGPPCQDFLRPFKFLCRYDWLPIATHCLRQNPVFQADNPARISPVVEDIA
ncbi:MAG: hypothetical protein B6D42_16070 [Anaerolineae bacterium UTCFX5]|nr:MAG: hypothetical protein B6D42_16070 [Anaerolineae bacterium UTCFX5]